LPTIFDIQAKERVIAIFDHFYSCPAVFDIQANEHAIAIFDRG
jgi:hypothetical protein